MSMVITVRPDPPADIELGDTGGLLQALTALLLGPDFVWGVGIGPVGFPAWSLVAGWHEIFMAIAASRVRASEAERVAVSPNELAFLDDHGGVAVRCDAAKDPDASIKLVSAQMQAMSRAAPENLVVAINLSLLARRSGWRMAQKLNREELNPRDAEGAPLIWMASLSKYSTVVGG